MDKNQFKNYAIAALVVVIVIILLVSGGKSNPSSNTQGSQTSTSSTTASSTSASKTSGTKTTTTTTSSYATKCNLKITSPIAYAKAGFPLVVQGTLDISGTKTYPCTWNENAQSAGTVQLFYNVRNTGWQSPGIPVSLFAQGTVNATSLSVSSAILSLNAYALGIPSGTPIKLTFRELDLPTSPSKNTFDLIFYLK